LTQRIGILGGTFNPVHYGHLAAAEEVRDRLKLDRVLFIPAFLPPHKDEDLPSAVQRLEMVRLAISGNQLFKASDIEIKRGGRSYTVDTIEELHQHYPGTELFFITALDSFLEIKTWKDWERLLSVCTFVVLSREGYRFGDLAALGLQGVRAEDLASLDSRVRDETTLSVGGSRIVLERIPYYEISSTDIRQRIQRGRSIKYLLPEPVERYIIENKLYG
jgi:nicotinate-nucleotide adenylyltransferase